MLASNVQSPGKQGPCMVALVPLHVACEAQDRIRHPVAITRLCYCNTPCLYANVLCCKDASVWSFVLFFVLAILGEVKGRLLVFPVVLLLLLVSLIRACQLWPDCQH